MPIVRMASSGSSDTPPVVVDGAWHPVTPELWEGCTMTRLWMELRSKIEAVLRKHELLCAGEGCGKNYKKHEVYCDTLTDDLLAVIPQPSREALEKIIREEVGGHHHYTCHIFCQAHWKIMGDRIMAWADQREPKVWCEHLRYKNMSKDEHLRPSGWYAISGEWCFYYAKDFKFCPLCAAPRPKDA